MPWMRCLRPAFLPALALALTGAAAAGQSAKAEVAAAAAASAVAPSVEAPVAAGPDAAGPDAAGPGRVVSINLCTDQLAMMLAAPGQLVSVSILAADPLSSSMAAEAGAWPVNYASAEQVFLLKPDLVLAGTYGAGPATLLLERLGIKVVRVAPVTSLEGVSGQIRTVAEALGREAEGEALIREFEAGLALLQSPLPPKSAALYYPNGYTTGRGSLSDDLLRAAGFRNAGADAGIQGGGILPLEKLILAAPDLIVTSTPYPGASRSEEILAHPALKDLRRSAGFAATTDADWICGTPHVLRALAQMTEARKALEPK